MNRKPILYALMFGFFFILDRVFFLKMTIGGFFFLGILLFFLMMFQDYWFRALTNDSTVRVNISGAKNITPIGPSEKRCVGRCPRLLTEDGKLAYPPVGFYPRGGLNSDFFIPLQGGGKKGYDIITDWGMWQNDDGGNQIVITEPYRIKPDGIPHEWRMILEKERKWSPQSPLFFYWGHTKVKRMQIPAQIFDITDMPVGDFPAMVQRANEKYSELEKEYNSLKSRFYEYIQLEKGLKPDTTIEKIKEALTGSGESGPEQGNQGNLNE